MEEIQQKIGITVQAEDNFESLLEDDFKQREIVKQNVIEKQLSATGENPEIPPMSEEAQRDHIKHIRPGGCFSGMPMNVYVEKGVSLARKPVDVDIVGYRGQNGCIVRYNKKTNEWVKAYIRGVASYVKPDLGEKYFLLNKIKDGGDTNDIN